jgi:acyl-CoA thioester hydrolase
VRYEVALFPGDERQPCAAKGHFIHVYVDRATRRPAPLPPELLSVLETLR